MTAMPTGSFQIAEIALRKQTDTPLLDWLRDEHEAGKTFRMLAEELYRLGAIVSHVTLASWYNKQKAQA